MEIGTLDDDSGQKFEIYNLDIFVKMKVTIELR